MDGSSSHLCVPLPWCLFAITKSSYKHQAEVARREPWTTGEEHRAFTSLVHTAAPPSCLPFTLRVFLGACSITFNHAKWCFVPIEMTVWLPSFLLLIWRINWSIFKYQSHLPSGLNAPGWNKWSFCPLLSHESWTFRQERFFFSVRPWQRVVREALKLLWWIFPSGLEVLPASQMSSEVSFLLYFLKEFGHICVNFSRGTWIYQWNQLGLRCSCWACLFVLIIIFEEMAQQLSPYWSYREPRCGPRDSAIPGDSTTATEVLCECSMPVCTSTPTHKIDNLKTPMEIVSFFSSDSMWWFE